MASGEMHVKATVVLAAPAAALALGIGAGLGDALMCSAGVLAGIVLSPDLDLDQRTRSEYIVSRYMGRIVGFLWILFWLPYAKLISHRSPLSHWPVLGTMLRIVYILALVSPMWLCGSWLILGSPTGLPMPGAALMGALYWALFGLILADTLHYLMDFLPFFRQSRRRRRRWWHRLR